MKKELLTIWVLLGILLSQVPMAFAGQCDPPGTVYREGCPTEVLDSSTCEEVSDFLCKSVWPHLAIKRLAARKLCQ